MKKSSGKATNFESGNASGNLLVAKAQAMFYDARRLHQEGKLQQAQQLYQQVLKMQPGNGDAWLLLGLVAYQTRQADRAIELINQSIQINPENVAAHSNLGVILNSLKQHQAAVQSYDKAIALRPDFVDAYVNRGNALCELCQFQAAIDSYSKAIALKPDHAEAYFNRGNAMGEIKQHQAAAESFRQAVFLKPDFAKAHFNLGLVLNDLKQYQNSLECYDRAIAINPEYAHAWYNRGNVLRTLRLHESALESYNSAVAFKPDYAEACYNRGNVLSQLGRHQEAVASYDHAIAITPDYVHAYTSRGAALCKLGQYHLAIASYGQAIDIQPGLASAEAERFYVRMKICDWTDMQNQFLQIRNGIEQGSTSVQPFDVLVLSDSLPLQRKAAEIWAKEVHPANPALGVISKRARDQKIRLGYFSADFHNHATAYLMAELFELHDKNRFELIGFSFGPDLQDEMRQRVSALFDQFLDVRSRTDEEVAKLSRQLGVDIAIDLKGFTQDERAGIFACRAAPLQVSYLGYPGTMGVDYIDYLIADPTLIPPESRGHYAEKIAYLPHSYQVNDSRRKISDKTFCRDELGLPASGFVFCCMNNSYKISPATFEGWMRILHRVTNSVLWLLEDNPEATVNLRRVAEKSGIDPHRLVFAQRVPLPEHLARQRAADLFIDTLPYNAHTTASDALWVGLPVLTCTGEAFASRVAASLLNAVGMAELVTSTQQAYEDLAVELACQPDRLKVIRGKLAANRLTFPLFDTPLFTRHIENVFLQMIERQDAGHPLSHLYVEQAR